MIYNNEKLMNFESNLKNKKIAIVGLGVSNIPLLDYFSNKNVEVTVFDQKSIEEPMQNKIKELGYKIELGKECLKKLIGFDIIFRSPSMLPTIPEFVNAVNNGAKLTSEIELVLELAPCKVIGITGTEGKTTTTSIVYEILKNSNKKCFLGGNIGIPLFAKIFEMKEEDVIILELSSFQLMNMKISPEISAVTNIYPDHLNIHSSYEEYINAKKNIFLHQTSKGKVILNFDNEITRNFENCIKGKGVFFSSKTDLENGYIYDDHNKRIVYKNHGTTEEVISKNEIKIRGIHNYENICVALAITDSIVTRKEQIEAIKNFKGVEHRLEYVRTINEVQYYNDSIGTSPASTIAGLDSFEENIILIAGGSDKGLDYTEIGNKIAQKVGTLILTGPTSEKIELATKKALTNSNKKIDIIKCKTLEEAVINAKKISKKGDVVLLSPASASFDAFKNFIERGKTFKAIVNNL